MDESWAWTGGAAALVAQRAVVRMIVEATEAQAEGRRVPGSVTATTIFAGCAKRDPKLVAKPLFELAIRGEPSAAKLVSLGEAQLLDAYLDAFRGTFVAEMTKFFQSTDNVGQFLEQGSIAVEAPWRAALEALDAEPKGIARFLHRRP